MARIKNIELPNEKHTCIGLTAIYGIGRNLAKTICENVEVDPAKKIKDLTEEEIAKLRKEIDNHVVEGDLRREVQMSIKEKMEIDKLNDSQEQFMQLFDIAFKKSFDAFFKQLMVVINRIEFNSRWSIKQTDIFMNQLKIPQTEDELSLSIINHPVTEVARREVLKDIRKMSSKKHELDNE